MVTNVRIDADGQTAAEVEKLLHGVADALDEQFGWIASRGELVIERQLAEPEGAHTAFHGRLKLHPNVASDSGQVDAFRRRGIEVSRPSWTATDAVAVGGTPYAGDTLLSQQG